jgi:NAD/NADP transhydrogenase beta subunit
MHLAEFGMLTAIIGTLMSSEIVSYEWIIAGLLLGSTIGLAMGLWVPMTAMPVTFAFVSLNSAQTWKGRSLACTRALPFDS